MRALGQMYERHAQEALLLQQKGAEWLLHLDAEAVSVEGAIRALVEGHEWNGLREGSRAIVRR